jgi:hypothetical protein
MCDRPNDPSIPNEERLWRRIRPDWVFRPPGQAPRPTSAAFKDNLSGEVSVFIASLTTTDTLLPQERATDSLAEITAGLARSAGYKVVRDPEGGLVPNDPSHVVLCPPRGVGKKRLHKAAVTLAEGATWVVPRS